MRHLFLLGFLILVSSSGFSADDISFPSNTITWRSSQKVSFDFSSTFPDVEKLVISPSNPAQLEAIFLQSHDDFGLSNNAHLKKLRIESVWDADRVLKHTYLPQLEILELDYDTLLRSYSEKKTDFIKDWSFLSNFPQLKQIKIINRSCYFYNVFKNDIDFFIEVSSHPGIEEVYLNTWMYAYVPDNKLNALLMLTNLKKITLSFHYHHYHGGYVDNLERILKQGLPNTEVVFLKYIQYPQDGGM